MVRSRQKRSFRAKKYGCIGLAMLRFRKEKREEVGKMVVYLSDFWKWFKRLQGGG